MASMWLVIPFIVAFSNPAKLDEGDLERRPAPIGHLAFEVAVSKELRKALGSEFLRFGRKQLIGLEDMYDTRLRLQKIIDRSGLTGVRVTVEYRLINDMYEVTFTVKLAPKTTTHYSGGSSIVI